MVWSLVWLGGVERVSFSFFVAFVLCLVCPQLVWARFGSAVVLKCFIAFDFSELVAS